MTGYEKIKKFVSEVHEINCALTDEIIEFIDEVIEQEQVGNVAKPDACPQLYEGWRDTSKELPETRDDVIICNKTNQCVSVGWYNSEHNLGEGKWLIRTANFDGDVELWQPLPSPRAFV